MQSWDDDNFVPPPVAKSNKWVGEDEEEDVKESWEDEDEEKKEEEENKAVEVKKAKKKSLAEKLAEKEAKKREELERRLKEQQEEDEVSPEEKLRMQKESDLKLALETTFGVKEENEIGGLKLPSTSEEFEEFTESLSKTIAPLSRHGNHYVNFIEELTRNLCASMNSADIKKIRNSLDNLHLEKQKIEKGDKAKKSKGKGKAKLKVEGDNAQLSAYTEYGGLDDYDDFI